MSENPAWHDVDRYFIDQLVSEDDALVAARESSEFTALPFADVSPTQGALLSVIARLSGARRVLEFGTLAGYSAIWLARAIGDEGRLITLELDEPTAAIARENLNRAGVGDRVEIVVGPAIDSARQLVASGAEPFDLVFIDADKRSNVAYLDWALRLARPGAAIVIDNVVRDGAVLDASSADESVRGVRALAERLAHEPRVTATALQTVGSKGWDGFVLALVRDAAN